MRVSSSDLCQLDKESPQYHKACNVGKVMGHVVALNYFKHKPNKNFSLMATTKGTYPVHVLEEDTEMSEISHGGFYHNSKFDYLDLHKLQRRSRKHDISYNVNPQHCVPGVSKHNKCDELLFLPETRACFNPRPFNRDEYQHDPN